MTVINLRRPLGTNNIYHGDARHFLKRIAPESVALSVWSPPYCVGKEYEKGASFESWKALLRNVIYLHYPIVKAGSLIEEAAAKAGFYLGIIYKFPQVNSSR